MLMSIICNTCADLVMLVDIPKFSKNNPFKMKRLQG